MIRVKPLEGLFPPILPMAVYEDSTDIATGQSAPYSPLNLASEDNNFLRAQNNTIKKYTARGDNLCFGVRMNE